MQPPADRANAVGRAKWLAELADALEQAQKLAWALGVSRGNSREAKALYGRLEEARSEVEALRRGRLRSFQADLDPLWPSLLPRGRPPTAELD